jgi:hypothetical protein
MIGKVSCGILLALAAVQGPALAQAEAWQHRWYWGAQGGLVRFQTPTAAGWQSALAVGGHWLITGSRSALYVSYDHMIFKDSTTSAVSDPSSTTGFRNVEFSTGRRIQAQLLVIPSDSWLQIYVGGGFGIHQVTDAFPTGTFSTGAAQEAVLRTIDETSTKAFPIATGGLQLRFGRLAVFGQGQYLPQGRNFLISSAQYVVGGGLRYALTGSREEVTTRR